MPEHLNIQQIEVAINASGLNNPEQLETVINYHLRSNPIIRCLSLSINNDGHIYSDIAETLSPKLQQHSNLPQVIQEIVSDIRERFTALNNITIDDWADDDVREQIVSLHKHVKNRLKERLELNRIYWSDVSAIIAATFGLPAVIDTSLKRDLYEAGYLQCVRISNLKNINLKKLLSALNEFYHDIQPYLNQIMQEAGDMVIQGVLLGLPETEQRYIILYVVLKSIWDYCNNRH